MEELIKRLVHKLWPEMAGGYHLPIFGEVVGVRETPGGAITVIQTFIKMAQNGLTTEQGQNRHQMWFVLSVRSSCSVFGLIL